MTTAAQLAQKFARASQDFNGFGKKVVGVAAFEIKKSVQAELASVVPDGRLNVGKRGQRVGVRYTIVGNHARVFATGPMQLIENDTKPHRIPRETVGRSRRANRKPVVIPGVGVRRYAMHPGTKGQQPFATGVANAEQAVADAQIKVMQETMSRVFK